VLTERSRRYRLLERSADARDRVEQTKVFVCDVCARDRSAGATREALWRVE